MDLDFFASRGIEQIPVHGPYSVSVPGAVDGWAALLDRYGAMPLAEVLKAPIEYAENGFPVSEIIAANWADRAEPIAERKDFREAYLPGGRAPRHGEVFRNPGLAWTYRQIAEGGRDAFYRGEIARRIVEHLDREGWPVSMDDLDSQHSDWVEPISTSYRQYELHELPPNGQGMAALEMLNILEGYDLRSLGHNSAAYLHLLLEAKKLAFADLDAWLADPERAELPVETIISKDYAAGQRKRIRRGKAAAGCRERHLRRRSEPHLVGRHRLPHRCRPRPQHGLVHQQPVSRVRLRRHRSGHRHRAAEPRRAVLSRTRASEPHRAAQAPVPHHHSRHGLRRAAGRGCRSASWAATCSRRATCRSC